MGAHYQPHGLGGIGLGQGSITDFTSLIANVPEAASAWQTVQAQFNAEGGAPPGVIPIAQSNFYDAFTQLTNTLKVLPNSAEGLTQAGLAAAGLVTNSSTIGGAIQNVEGLVGAVESGVPGNIVQSFTGVLVSGLGLAVAAGACSFGVGAAIVVGLELVGAVIGQLFGGGGQPSASICGVNFNGPAPNYVVNCAWSYGQAVPGGPHSMFWRKFPNPNNSNDAWWFAICGIMPGQYPACVGMPSTNWTSGSSSDQWGASTGMQHPVRPIDAAFPAYHQLECDLNAVSIAASLPDTGGSVTIPVLGTFNYSAQDVAFARFIKGYYGAWTANQEYALNGLKPQDDVTVFKQFLQFWNAAHDSSMTRTISPPSLTSGLGDVFSAVNYGTSYGQNYGQPYEINPCQGNFGNEYYYVQMIVGDLRHTDTSVLDSNGNLVINVGPKKVAPAPTPIVHPIPRFGGSYPPGIVATGPTTGTPAANAPAAVSGTSTASTWLIGLGIAGGVSALALEYYAYRHHMTLGQATKHLWQETKSKFHRTPRLRSAPSRTLPRTRRR